MAECRAQRLDPVVRGDHLEAALAHHLRRALAVVRIVVDDEHQGAGHTPAGGAGESLASRMKSATCAVARSPQTSRASRRMRAGPGPAGITSVTRAIVVIGGAASDSLSCKVTMAPTGCGCSVGTTMPSMRTTSRSAAGPLLVSCAGSVCNWPWEAARPARRQGVQARARDRVPALENPLG